MKDSGMLKNFQNEQIELLKGADFKERCGDVIKLSDSRITKYTKIGRNLK